MVIPFAIKETSLVAGLPCNVVYGDFPRKVEIQVLHRPFHPEGDVMTVGTWTDGGPPGLQVRGFLYRKGVSVLTFCVCLSPHRAA